MIPITQPDLFEDLPTRGRKTRRPRQQVPAESTNTVTGETVPNIDAAVRAAFESTAGDHPETSHDDIIPARMMNEFVYCQRLFFYEHVDGVFSHNADTLRGNGVHKKVDSGNGALAAPDSEEIIHSRSVQMGSKKFGISAKLDLVESARTEGEVSPVDYKAGSPREGKMWPTDRMQLGLQILILRENGYACSQGFIYYRGTKQRVSLAYSEELESWISENILAARALMVSGQRPPPLVDSPKCPRCSLVSVCLPDETRLLAHGEPDGPVEDRVRRLIAARDDTRALYLNTQGLRIGLKDRTLQVRDKESLLQEIRLQDIHHVALFGNLQVSTQAIHQLCREDIPITYFSMGGWFHGITRGHSLPNILMRRAQFRAADEPATCLNLARRFVSGKIRNCRKMLMRNALEQPTSALLRLKAASHDAMAANSLPELLGIEGAAAGLYFSEFPGMLKPDTDDLPGLERPDTGEPPMRFDFEGRNRRPPTDPVNALLSLAYSVLAKDCTIALLAVGFDPWLGFYHQPRPGRPALALDLMEEFRPLISESCVLSAINTRMITPDDFVRAGEAVNLSETGRKKFFMAYERRMGDIITHPVFDYKVSYRRALELQARLLARALEHEISEYVPMMTR